jgi:thymidylate synthase (FAD)
MKVTLKAITSPSPELQEKGINDAERFMVYCARVSNPANQFNTDTSDRLINYCIKHQHWSIFEQAFCTFEIETSRAVAAQILRHRSFTFQEFSQRYSTATLLEPFELRKQGKTNRQVGDEVLTVQEDPKLFAKIDKLQEEQINVYNEMIQQGIARESARMVLPLNTQTTLYVSGSVRSFIHYLQLRTKEETQKEHREVALEMKKVFCETFPNIAKALKWG